MSKNGEVRVNENENARTPFGQLKVASETLQSSNISTYDTGIRLNGKYSMDFWDEFKVGTGTVTHLPNESSTLMTIGGIVGDKIVHTQHFSNLYQAGNAFKLGATGDFGGHVVGQEKGWGYIDDNDGLALVSTGTGWAFKLRTSTSGSPVDVDVLQASWDLDNLDGLGGPNNPSGLKLDELADKGAHAIIDGEWQGFGGVRLGIEFGNNVVYVHRHVNVNLSPVVYMKTANLPIRYWIENKLASVGGSLKRTCARVSVEGGINPLEIDGRKVSLLIPAVAMNITAPVTPAILPRWTPIAAIKLSEVWNGQKNKSLLRLISAEAMTDKKPIQLMILRNTVITDEGTGTTYIPINSLNGADDVPNPNSSVMVSAAGIGASLINPLYANYVGGDSYGVSQAADKGTGTINQEGLISVPMAVGLNTVDGTDLSDNLVFFARDTVLATGAIVNLGLEFKEQR